MKSRPMFFVLLLLALLITACGPTPTPTAVAPEPATATSEAPTQAPPTPEPPTATAAPAGSGDPTWDRILASGKMVIGTSADYKPFEYYDSSNNIDGFDPAIIREVGARLGLQVVLVDYAFEGLPTGLQTGDIDAVIAAMSVTADRQNVMDFSDVYYSGQDTVLARQGSGIPKITTATQLAAYRVGVQRGTTYESWIQKTLVEPGLMPAANLLQYDKPEHAVRDLKENRNDLVLMGTIPAQEYIKGGGVEAVGQSLNVQLFAIAMPKGSSVLKTEINKKLVDMRNDGTLAKFSNAYLKTDITQNPPVPTPPPAAATPTPAACFDSMQFVADVTIPDGTVMNPGQDFDKVWRMRNNGTCAWDSTYRLVFVQGDLMGGAPMPVNGVVNPGNQYDITIDQTAPSQPGDYTGWWQMVNGKNIAFGPRLYVSITVHGAPEPTATVVPPVQPTTSPKPTINSFTADPTSVALNGLVVVQWSFSGDSLATARLSRTDPDGTVVALYGGQDVPPSGQYEDMAVQAGNLVYTLVVSNEFGGSTTATVTVTVNP